MRNVKSLIILVFLIVNFGCSYKKIDLRLAKDRNVCATLNGKVLFYVIFVDGKHTKPWTGFDIRSTQDSLKKVTSWIQDQAVKAGAQTTIQLEYFHANGNYAIAKDLPKKTLYETLESITDQQGWKKIHTWGDNVSKKSLVAFPETKNYYKILLGGDNPKKAPKPSDTEKLIVALREKYKIDNVAVFMMLNNYYKDDVSVTVNTISAHEPEYAINSNKDPLLIAQQFLSLFGAHGFYTDKKGDDKPPVNNEQIATDFPDEVMLFHNGKKDLAELNIGPVTQYLLGWTMEHESRYDKVHFRNIKESY